MFDPAQYLHHARQAGCPADQVENFIRAGIILQPRQLAASAAARLCDQRSHLVATRIPRLYAAKLTGL
jgi:hypothetical protein